MPELPEVDVAARLLDRAAAGKVISELRTFHPAFERRLSAARAAAVRGRRIDRVERRGKHLLLHLDDHRVLHSHFRMTGDWEVVPGGESVPRHTRALLALADGTRLALVDSRALGTLTLHDAGAAVLPALGPEPFDAAFDAQFLGAALAARRGGIKPALLDQRVVAGLGNIYAAEALWVARISPRAVASGLSRPRRARLISAIRRVLRGSLAGRYWAVGRSTRWRVYDREGRPCSRCGSRIRRIVQGGRSTYYCPRCQRA